MAESLNTASPLHEDVIAAAELQMERTPQRVILAPGVRLTITGELGELQGVEVDPRNRVVRVPVTATLEIGVAAFMAELRS